MDISTFPDLDVSGQSITGRREALEAAARRLITAPGSIAYDATYGLDLREWLSKGLSAYDLARLRALILDQLEQDDRIGYADVTLTEADEALLVSVSVDDSTGSWSGLLQVDNVTLTILGQL